ncbi:MAG TPA: hypothetical protein PLR30_09620, partial [Saprospiraceae bacterium]|nr:hypothetical protein [Saprospiraceae bacterium]
YELLWDKNAVFNPAAAPPPNTTYLFEPANEHFELPVLHEGPFDQAFDELELLGFPLCSPFSLIEGDVPPHIMAHTMARQYKKKTAMLGYYVARKPVRTVNGKLMYFYTWVDEAGDFFDSVHFPPAVVASPFKGHGCYLIRGRITEDFGFYSIEAAEMEKLPWVKDGRY